MSLTASYSQTESGTKDSSRVGLLLPGAQFFINQTSEVNYLRKKDSVHVKADSLSSIEISKHKEALDSCQASSNYKDSVASNYNKAVDELATNNVVLKNENNVLKDKIKTKNKTIVGMAIIMVLKALIIIQSIK